eukprot:g18684.t1
MPSREAAGEMQATPNLAMPEANQASAGGSKIAHVTGSLGLAEVWVFIVYVLGEAAHFTTFEATILTALATCELIGVLPVILTLLYMCSSSYTTANTERLENLKTLTRDSMHNLVYPRSAPGSRRRKDFASMAWCGMLLNSAWVLLFLSFYPAWGGRFDEDRIWRRVCPSLVAVISVLDVAYIARSTQTNRSSHALTSIYMNAKVTSLFVLATGFDRLVFGKGVPDLAQALGPVLVVLQVVKVCSAFVAIRRYHAGTPDEKLPHSLVSELC